MIHAMAEWVHQRLKDVATPAAQSNSGEKKYKQLRSESIPEFNESIKNMSQEDRDKIDKALRDFEDDTFTETMKKMPNNL